MKPYPSYKNSGVEWIGSIPTDWCVKRLKYFTRQKKEKSDDGSEELLSVSEYLGVVPRKILREGEDHLTRSESLEGYLKVSKGNLVNNIMLMWKKGLGISDYEGIVSPAYSVFIFNDSIPKYFHYLLRTDLYITEYRKNSTGIIDSRLRLYDDDFGNIFSFFPPLPEQKQIVSFLDHKTQKIDELIEKTEKKIELLKEKRTALINHCVTKGLNPNVEMKDSGVEWIGKIPSRWVLSNVKYLLKDDGFRSGPFGSSLITNQLAESGNYLVYTPEHLTDKKIEYPLFVPLEREDELKKYEIRDGDIVLPIVGTLGRGKLFTSQDEQGILNQRLCRISPDSDKVVTQYLLNFLTNTNLVKIQFDLEKKGSILDHITREIILNFILPLPPLPEQQEIVEYLDKQTQKIDTTIEKETQRIELLKEYRQSLISEVVTGKIDVRDEVVV